MEENLINGVRKQMEKELGKLEGRVDGHRKELDTLSKDLYGNGREGLTDRMVRVEDKLDTVEEKLDDIQSDITTIRKSLSNKILFTRKELYYFAGTIFVGISLWILLLSSSIPEDFVIWDVISNIIGL